MKDGSASAINYDEYYKNNLKEAHEYQDYVCEQLIKNLGISITNYQSKKYQFNKGENLQGVEIKYDKKFAKTGNLYIETHEKSNPNNQEYVKSGIYRLDNSWLYAIGDYQVIYIFSKRYLQTFHRSNKFKNITTPTSKGFLINKENAEKYHINKIEFE